MNTNIPIPDNEEARLDALRSYEVLDTDPENRLDNLTKLASEICKTPIGLISLIDEDRQWFKSKVGLDAPETPRDISFCQHAIMEVKLFEVENALEDERFKDNPLVQGDPNIRFYAGQPIIDENGFALGTLCVIDREQRKLDDHQRNAMKILAEEIAFEFHARTERIRRKSYEKFFNMSLDMLCIAGTDGFFKEINPSFTDVLGWDVNYLMSKPFFDFIHPDDIPSTMSEVEKLSQGVTTIGFENRYQRKDGGWTWMHWTCQPDPRTGELFAVAHDVSDLKKALEDLETSYEQLDQFAYVVSHDLKAPLRAISTLSTFLEEDLGDKLDEDNKKNMTLLRSRVSRMEMLIKGILQYSRVGRSDDPIEMINVSELLNEIIAGLNIPDGFTLNLSSNYPEVSFRKIQLFQVFQNLLSNAIKYHDKTNGNISVEYNSTDLEHQFSVIDDGPGIAEDYHEKIFGIFQTLQSRDEIESTGIGLSIVKKILQDAGGNIEIISDGETGSEFKFKFPKTIK